MYNTRYTFYVNEEQKTDGIRQKLTTVEMNYRQSWQPENKKVVVRAVAESESVLS